MEFHQRGRYGMAQTARHTHTFTSCAYFIPAHYVSTGVSSGHPRPTWLLSFDSSCRGCPSANSKICERDGSSNDNYGGPLAGDISGGSTEKDEGTISSFIKGNKAQSCNRAARGLPEIKLNWSFSDSFHKIPTLARS